MFFLILKVFGVAVIGYLLGSLNSSLIVGKFYHVDVRKHGSGSAGTTNTLRTLGKVAAVLVILGDVLKGIIACLVGLYIVKDVVGNDHIGLMAGGVAAIVGHNWPLYFGFKGGKGALTSITVVMMMDWRIGLIVLGIFILTVAISRYVSLGSLFGAIMFPIISWIPFFEKTNTFIVFALIVSFLAILMHRSNIERLFKGTESKLGGDKKVPQKGENA